MIAASIVATVARPLSLVRVRIMLDFECSLTATDRSARIPNLSCMACEFLRVIPESIRDLFQTLITSINITLKQISHCAKDSQRCKVYPFPAKLVAETAAIDEYENNPQCVIHDSPTLHLKSAIATGSMRYLR